MSHEAKDKITNEARKITAEYLKRINELAKEANPFNDSYPCFIASVILPEETEFSSPGVKKNLQTGKMERTYQIPELRIVIGEMLDDSEIYPAKNYRPSQKG